MTLSKVLLFMCGLGILFISGSQLLVGGNKMFIFGIIAGLLFMHTSLIPSEN